RRLGDPLARLPRHARARPDGQQARHPARAGGRRGRRRAQPAHGARLGPRPTGRDRGGQKRCLTRRFWGPARRSHSTRAPSGRGSLAVMDTSAFSEPQTRQARELLDGWGQAPPTLVVLGAEESTAALSFRNLQRVAVLDAASVGVSDLLGAASLVLSRPALEALSARATTQRPV